MAGSGEAEIVASWFGGGDARRVRPSVSMAGGVP